MLGYTGKFEGKPVSVQSTGMGCPSAAIVIEELVQLGVKRFLRVGTCGGLQPDLALGDLIVARLGGARPTAPRGTTSAASRTRRPPTGSSSTEPSTRAKELGKPVRVGAIVSSDVFYDPDTGAARALVGARRARRRDGGGGAVHDRRAARGPGRLPADGQRHRRSSGEFTRISDDELRAAVDRMTRSRWRPSPLH